MTSQAPPARSASRPTPASRPRSRQRKDVQGLRAVAILSVVLYHAHVSFASGGYIGVDVFFVVSGFLITGLLWRELEGHGRISFGSFYARRARRLLPVSVLVVCVTLLASARWLAPLRVHSVVKDGLASSLYVANFRFALQSTSYLASSASPSPFQHFWSLAVEEQFYLVWPALLAGIWYLWCSPARRARPGRHTRRTRRPSQSRAAAALGVVCVSSFALSWWLTSANQPLAFFLLPSRAWELGAGGLVALATPWLRRVPEAVAVGVGWIGVALIGWSIYRLSEGTAFPGTAALLPVIGALAVIAAGSTATASPVGPVSLLGRRGFQVVGILSYSWYLWHWPVLVIAPALVGHALGVWANLGLVAFSGVLAAATVVIIEAPVRYAGRLALRPGASMALAGGLTATAVVCCGLVAVALPSLQGHGVVVLAGQAGQLGSSKAAADPAAAAYSTALANVAGAVSASLAPQSVPANLEPSLNSAHGDKAPVFVDGCLDSFTETVVRTCAFGNTSSPTTVVLFGDSHAAQWFPAYDKLAISRGWRLVVITKATCPPVDIDVFSPELGRTYRECDAWKVNALARIRAEHPVLVVLGVARHYNDLYHFTVYSPAWDLGLSAMVNNIGETGAKVAVMGPIPKPPADVPECLSAHLANSTACDEPIATVYDRIGVEAEQSGVARSGGFYLDTHSWFCADTTCAAIVGNLLVYRDDNHITTNYAAWLAPTVGAALDQGPLRSTAPSS